MASTETAATPTDHELEAVRRVAALAGTTDAPGWLIAEIRDAAAQALADQRARYEAVADELEDVDYEPGFDASPDYWAGRMDGADRIRQVAR